jgi:hypothetical protein
MSALPVNSGTGRANLPYSGRDSGDHENIVRDLCTGDSDRRPLKRLNRKRQSAQNALENKRPQFGGTGALVLSSSSPVLAIGGKTQHQPLNGQIAIPFHRGKISGCSVRWTLISGEGRFPLASFLQEDPSRPVRNAFPEAAFSLVA